MSASSILFQSLTYSQALSLYACIHKHYLVFTRFLSDTQHLTSPFQKPLFLSVLIIRVYRQSYTSNHTNILVLLFSLLNTCIVQVLLKHYFQFQMAKEEIQFCIRNLVNYTQIQQEIDKAKPTGDLDIVFRKYCRQVNFNISR